VMGSKQYSDSIIMTWITVEDNFVLHHSTFGRSPLSSLLLFTE
jgi:hypothetical protein